MTIPSVAPANSLGRRIVTLAATSALVVWAVRQVGPRIDPALLRLSGGRLSTVMAFPALVLTHTGARSGITRSSPIVYFTDRGRVIVIASNFGSPRNPGWYHNVKAHPEVTLFGRGFSGRFIAEEITGAERDRLFDLAKNSASPYRSYENSAGARSIPVVAFSPAS